MSDKNKLVPVPIDVTVGDETFHILPFGFEMQVCLSAKLAAAFAQAGFKEGDTLSFSDLVDHAGDVLFDAAAVAIGKPRSYLSTLPEFEDGMRILEAVYEANAEVFAKKVLPSLMKRLQTMASNGALSSLMKSLLA
jgi:hypothetical protein